MGVFKAEAKFLGNFMANGFLCCEHQLLWSRSRFCLMPVERNHFPLLFFQADVCGAYDTIPHWKVLEVIARILGPNNKSNYCIRRYAVIVRMKNGQIITKYRRHVRPALSSVSPTHSLPLLSFWCCVQLPSKQKQRLINYMLKTSPH